MPEKETKDLSGVLSKLKRIQVISIRDLLIALSENPPKDLATLYSIVLKQKQYELTIIEE